jgi:hypothetical protein
LASRRRRATGPRISYRWLAIALAAATTMLAPNTAAFGDELDLRPTSSLAARREAVQAIPLASLRPENRHQVQTIIENASLYRRLPTKVVTCDPQLFSLFMEHPHAVVNLWEVLGISRVRMAPRGQGVFQATDGNGTQGTIQMLECVCDEKAQNRAVVLASGTFQGSGVPGPIRANCIALIRSGSIRDHNGTAYITARTDIFIHLEQVGVELVARTFQPLLVRVADRNFEQTMDFVSSFSDAAAKNPRGVERLATRLDHVAPEIQGRIASIAYGLSQERASAVTKTGAMQPQAGHSRVSRAPQNDE